MSPEEAAQVRELIAGQHSKAALQLAKDLAKRCGTPEAEALLVEAYKARIEDLLKLGMTVEAKALLGVVRERFPGVLPALAEINREICAVGGRLDEVVGPLSDSSLPDEDRERIEAFIRQRISDLTALAAVSSLPPEHSLRVAASALATAFDAVTKGPVDEVILALPEVSRRSPLASWKALVRAIASYHRREDEQCRKWLEAIAPDSAPARLIPAINAMLGAKPESKPNSRFSLAEEKLIAAAGDHGAALRPALSALEAAFHGKKQRPILDAARNAMAASEHCETEIRERLRQHIAVRSIMQHIQLPAISAAMGGAPRQSAYFYRLLARTLEEPKHEEGYAEAAIIWGDFRREAIKEGWFTAGGMEDGVLSLHMAELIAKLPADLLEEMKDRQPSHRKSGKWDNEDILPSAGLLYRRACEADPHSESFQKWLNWARKQGPWQEADDVAERWRKARPADIHPLLYLMESAEKRNAFKKSLKYLEEAEKLDRLSPEVRRAKLRLLLSTITRHLDQRKIHLAMSGIEQLETVPEVRPGEIAALSAALRWCAAATERDKAGQLERETALNNSLGNVAAHLLIAALIKTTNLGVTISAPALKVAKTPASELLAGAVKACVMGQWVDLHIPLPLYWCGPLIAALNLPGSPVDVSQLLVLGEEALNVYSRELAYAVSVAGLANGGANAAFLFLRGRSLLPYAALRREGCFTAALELARRERNTKLAGRILDHLNGKQLNGNGRWTYGFGGTDDPSIASRPVSLELLSQILEEEQKLTQFPVPERYREPKYAEELDSQICDCPKCRAKRGQRADDFDDEDEDDFEDEFDDDEDDFDGPPPAPLKGLARMLEVFLDSLPPELAQKVKRDIATGEDPMTAIRKVMNEAHPNTPFPPPSKKDGKAPPPDQGSLF